MVDIHTHILPGIDDGAQDITQSLEMARIAAETGVEMMVATPHSNLPGVFDNYFGQEYIRIFQNLTNVIEQERIPIQFYPGMEAFGTYDLPDLIVAGKIIPLNQSCYILMEFSFDEDPEFATDLLKRVTEVGARPVVAHVERYHFIQEYPQIAFQWRKRGYVLQVNKGSFLGRFGNRAQNTAYRLMRHHLVSVIASDAHSPYQRTPYLLDAYEELCLEYQEQYLDVLFHQNPKRICENQPILKLEPIPFSDDRE